MDKVSTAKMLKGHKMTQVGRQLYDRQVPEVTDLTKSAKCTGYHMSFWYLSHKLVD